MNAKQIGSDLSRKHASGFLRGMIVASVAAGVCHSLNAHAQTNPSALDATTQVAPELKESPSQLEAVPAQKKALPNSEVLGELIARKKQFAKIDALAEHGQLTEMPPPSESIFGDTGGLRSELAEHGIGINLLSLNSFADNVLDHDRHNPQAFSGEKPTYSSNLVGGFTYDLGRVGLTNGQFIFSLQSFYSSWEPGNPSSEFSFARIAYYQSLFNKTLEFKVGVFPNDLEFIGPFTGGTLVGGTQGLQAIIPFEVGLSHAPTSTPAANVTVNVGNFYNKFGIQRSLSSDGAQAEVDLHLGELDLHVDHTGELYINEIGYKRDASPTNTYAWFRAGGIYNNSEYTQFLSTERSENNHAEYALADYQFHKFDSAIASRGIYGGFTVMSAPKDRNLFDLYYGLRLYAKGPFEQRPFDMLSFEYGYTSYSDDANKKLDMLHVSNADDSKSYSVAYNMRLSPGLYFRTGLSFVENPAFSPDTKNALNLQEGLTLFF